MEKRGRRNGNCPHDGICRAQSAGFGVVRALHVWIRPTKRVLRSTCLKLNIWNNPVAWSDVFHGHIYGQISYIFKKNWIGRIRIWSMGTNFHCEATWIYLLISLSTAAKYIYIYTSQHFTSSDFHITTSLSFLPQDSSLKHPKLPPDPVKGLRHRQRQNATSKPSKNYLDTS